jgi:peptide/nickel transport system permease protein
MFLFVVRRLLIAIPILILSSILVFVLVVNAGDPLENLRSRPNSEQQIRQKVAEYHLDEPVFTRYVTWATGFLHGDFGKDATGQEVRPKLFRAMWTTLRLVVAAALIAVLLGLTVGVISAIRQYTAFDYGSTFTAFLFFAMPVFWFAVLLKEFGAIDLNNWLQHPGISWLGAVIVMLVFAGLANVLFNNGEKRSRRRGWTVAAIGAGVGLVLCLVLELWFSHHSFTRWISTIGPQSPVFKGSFFARLGDIGGHMVLPTITLAVISFATYSRFQRASMLDTMSSDYVRTARAKGLSNKRVIFRHAFRTALIPVVTLIAIDFGLLLGGAIITETVFQWRGMGTLFYNAVLKDIDPNTAMAYLMVTATMVIVFNIVADIAYAYLDPRIRID